MPTLEETFTYVRCTLRTKEQQPSPVIQRLISFIHVAFYCSCVMSLSTGALSFRSICAASKATRTRSHSQHTHHSHRSEFNTSIHSALPSPWIHPPLSLPFLCIAVCQVRGCLLSLAGSVEFGVSILRCCESYCKLVTHSGVVRVDMAIQVRTSKDVKEEMMKATSSMSTSTMKSTCRTDWPIDGGKAIARFMLMRIKPSLEFDRQSNT